MKKIESLSLIFPCYQKMGTLNENLTYLWAISRELMKFSIKKLFRSEQNWVIFNVFFLILNFTRGVKLNFKLFHSFPTLFMSALLLRKILNYRSIKLNTSLKHQFFNHTKYIPQGFNSIDSKMGSNSKERVSFFVI